MNNKAKNKKANCMEQYRIITFNRKDKTKEIYKIVILVNR
jgi:hypothetical protein